MRLEVSQSHQTVPFYVRYSFLLVRNSNFVFKSSSFPIFDFKNVVTLKTGLGVRQGRWKYHHAIVRSSR